MVVYEPFFYFEFLCVANKKIDSSFSLSETLTEEKSVVVLLKTKQNKNIMQFKIKSINPVHQTNAIRIITITTNSLFEIIIDTIYCMFEVLVVIRADCTISY